MAIRSSLLALLSERDSYGYELKRLFEERTGGSWPVNIGQVYSTLTRLERDGLVESVGEDDAGHVVYRATDSGRATSAEWFLSPVVNEQAPRDELVIKLALAMNSPGIDVPQLLNSQRASSLRRMQELTRLKSDSGHDPAWLLVVDRLLFDVEAELRWLDHCERQVLRHHNDLTHTTGDGVSAVEHHGPLEAGTGRTS